ncbi:MAG TPA: autotransporter-associated beta strand repeat-containing protein [Tepidisphaeraceae bacterium]|nr:autotransporter-associated beta strand repeat-containing protein [Tepidisphaeraceae bacterium]
MGIIQNSVAGNGVYRHDRLLSAKKNITKQALALAVAAGVSLLCARSSQAANGDDTWLGNSSAFWSDGANWNPATNAPPVSGDSLVFGPAGSSGVNLTDDLTTPAGFNVAGITYNAGADAFVINPALAGTNGFSLTGSIVNNSTSLQTINDLISLPGTQTITANTGNITLGGAISGGGGLAINGAGTVTLSATNTFTGPLTVSTGTLAVSGGSIANLGTLITQGGGAMTIANASVTLGSNVGFGDGFGLAGTGSITVNNGGALSIGNGGGLVFVGGGGSSGPFGSGILTVNAGGSVTVGAPGGFPSDDLYLGGYGGAGTINLNGGTFTSARPIDGNAGAIINYNGGTLRAGFSSTNFMPANITSNVQAGGAIIDTNGFNIAIGQSLNHDPSLGATLDGGLTKLGNGNLSLANSNSFTGPVTINAGTLTLPGNTNNSFLPGNPTIAVNNGATLAFSGYNTFGLTLSSMPAVTVNSGGTILSSNVVTCFNNLTLNNGTVSVNGNDNYGSTWGSLGFGGTTTATGTSAINVVSGNGTISNGNGQSQITAFTINTPAVTDSLTVSPVIQSSLNLVKQGAGTLTLAGADTYSGATTVSAGTLTVSSTGSITSGGGLSVDGPSTIANLAGGYTNTSGGGAVSLSNGGTINVTGNVTVGGSNNSAFYIGYGSTGTVNVTAGSLALTYANSNGFGIGWQAGGNGTLNISGGTVSTAVTDVFYIGYGATSAVGNVNVGGTGVLNIGSGGILFVGGGPQGSGSGYGTGTLTISSGGVVTVGAGGAFPADNLYLAGYGGTGTINLNGGTLSTARNIVNGAGSSTFNFNGGTLQAAANGTILGFGNYSDPNGGFLAQANIQSGGAILDSNGFIANITQPLLDGGGGGGVTKIGTGTLVLDGVASTYTGGTTVSAGTLKASGNLGAASSPVSVASGATLDLGGSIQATGPITLAGGTIVHGMLSAPSFTANNGSISTAITGSTVLNKTAAGTLTVSGAGSFTGGANLSAGTIVIGSSSVVGTNPAAGYKIVAAGDSITAGVGVSNPATQAWPAVLGSLLGSNFTVLNEGHSGATAMVDGNLPYTGTPEYSAGLAANPNAVVIQLGTNDSSNANFALGTTDFVNSLTSIVNAYQATANHPKIFLALPPAIYEPGPADNQANLLQLLPYIQQVATATGSTLIDNQTMLLNEATLYADGLHPGNLGSQLIGQNVYASLASTFFNNGPLGNGTLTLSGGTLSDDGNPRTLNNAVAITGNVTFSSAGNGSLTFDPAGLATPTTTVISNSPTLTVTNTTTFKEAISGTGFTKAGAGTLVLAATNTYSGTTNVNAGTLSVTGSIPSNGSVKVASSAVLMGTGSVGNITGGALGNAGLVGPGQTTTPGVLTAYSVDPTSSGSVAFSFRLNAAAPAYSSPTGNNDALHIVGITPLLTPLTSANVESIFLPALSSLTVNETFAGGLYTDNLPGTALSTATALATYAFYVQDPNGTTTYDGNTYSAFPGTITHSAINSTGDGSSGGGIQNFTVTSVPEPASLSLLALAAGGLLWRRRRR